MPRQGKLRAFLVEPDDKEWSVFWAETSAGRARYRVVLSFSDVANWEVGELFPHFFVRRLPQCDHLAQQPGELNWEACLDALGAVEDEDGRWSIPEKEREDG